MALDYIPSPGWAVIYGETPSATRWSELGDNDDALATGAGIDDDALDSRHYAGASVDGEHLSANAIRLGYADTATSQGSITSSETALTSLSVTVTVPAGGRSVKLTASIWPSTTAAGDVCRLYFKEGSTYFGFHTFKLPDATAGFSQNVSIIVPAPSAGSHTYFLTMYRQSGSGTITSNAGAISAANTKPFLLAELV